MAEEIDDPELSILLSRWASSTSDFDPLLASAAAVLAGVATQDQIEAVAQARARDSELERDFVVAGAPQPARHRTWAVTSILAAAAAVGGIAILLPGSEELQPKSGRYDRLSIAVERDGRRFELDPSQALRERDRFGLFYSATDEGHLTVVHRSSGGDLTILHPADGNSAIAPGEGVPLTAGGIVRDVTGCEWMIAAFSARPIAADRFGTAIRVEDADCRLSLELPEARATRAVRIVK